MKYYDRFEPDTYYHIFNHAVGTENLFRSDDNFRYFLKKYHAYTTDIWETFAYCLMPNHFHFLVRIKNYRELQQLPKFKEDVHLFTMQRFSNFLNGYAKAYNIKNNRKGALFIDKTRRTRVNDDAYFTTLNQLHTSKPYTSWLL